jgi:translation elongation factor EF-G
MDLFSALVSIEVMAPLDRCGDIMGELSRVGGTIEGFEPSDPCHVSAKIPAAALKGIEIWVEKTFADRGKVELRPIDTDD